MAIQIDAAQLRQARKDAYHRIGKVRLFSAIAEGQRQGAIRDGVTSASQLQLAEHAWLCSHLGLEHDRDVVQPYLSKMGAGVPHPVQSVAHAPVPQVEDEAPDEAQEEAPEEDEAQTPLEREADEAEIAAKVEELTATLPVLRMLDASARAPFEEAARELAREALKPPVQVIKHVPVPGAASGAVVPFPAPVAPARKAQHVPHITRREAAHKVFGFRSRKDLMAPVAVWDAPDAPPVDPDFVWDPDLLSSLVLSIEHGDAVWLYGPKGSGKTTAFAQYAARTGRPFVRIGCRPDMESVEVVGMNAIAGGSSYFKEGAYLRAIQRPGTIILWDEPTLAPRIHALLQTSLDMRFLTVTEDEGRVVRLANGVVIVAADNSAGHGEAAETYHGTAPANAAFLDRFAKKIRVDGLDETGELRALMARSGAPEPLAQAAVTFARRTRERASSTGDLAEGVMFRSLVYWLTDMMRGAPAVRAYRETVENGLKEGDRLVIEEIRKACLPGFPVLDKLALGEDVPPEAEPVQTNPNNAKARNSFDTL